jgi:5-(carboxyamino)imidazole ribonucleotide synthase
VADLHLNAGYLDDDALAQMDALCRAVTTEFENVPAGALDRLQRNCAVSPAGRCVAIAQDRAVEKAFIAAQGVPVAPHAVIVSAADLAVGDDVGPLGGEGFQKGDQVVVTVEAGEVDGRHELETSNVIADQ